MKNITNKKANPSTIRMYYGDTNQEPKLQSLNLKPFKRKMV